MWQPRELLYTCYLLIAKFHYTDTDTDPTRTRSDPHGPNFAAKKSVSVSVSVKWNLALSKQWLDKTKLPVLCLISIILQFRYSPFLLLGLVVDD